MKLYQSLTLILFLALAAVSSVYADGTAAINTSLTGSIPPVSYRLHFGLQDTIVFPIAHSNTTPATTSFPYTLPASVNTALNAHLANLSNTGAQITWLKTVSVKITTLLAQTTSSASLQNLLQALQQLVESKITNLSENGGNPPGSIIGNLFN